ncbi:MAG: tRNA guanosine(34) transglycosylase Tgt [Defluviitaleaceae bacterium]|nr:tRNA guanosine(34) transglycosylase Tgt [Defluviitaleaceae bacterium]
MYKVLTTQGRAKRAQFTTPHGTVQTPVFMNVATAAAIKGALDAGDLRDAGCQLALCNTYHLHLRPGEDVVHEMGGLRRFMGWDGPVLTDSGGFQVYSLAKLRKIKEEGVTFASHIDGRRIFMGPEESMAIQAALGTTIAMAFDECPPHPAERKYIEDSVARTTRWLARCKDYLAKRETEGAYTPLLFGINQGGIYTDIRIEHAKQLVANCHQLAGYALGGLAVGESHEDMYNVLEATVPHLPQDKPTYLMGVGTPQNLLEAIERGVDFFDCVLPARNGRHGHLYTSQGKINLFNAVHERADIPIDPTCDCRVCATHSRAYLRHLFKAKELLAMRLAVMHNLHFYNHLMQQVRNALDVGTFDAFKKSQLSAWDAD